MQAEWQCQAAVTTATFLVPCIIACRASLSSAFISADGFPGHPTMSKMGTGVAVEPSQEAGMAKGDGIVS